MCGEEITVQGRIQDFRGGGGGGSNFVLKSIYELGGRGDCSPFMALYKIWGGGVCKGGGISFAMGGAAAAPPPPPKAGADRQQGVGGALAI